MALMDILRQYATGTATPQTEQHFDEVATQAPPDVLRRGITEALASDKTAPFPDLVAQLFQQSNPQQRAGLLNNLLGSINPAVLSSIAGGALGSILGTGNAQAAPQVTPAQASQVSPGQVAEVAKHAEQHDPSVIDRVGGFYAQHPQVVKALGGIALAIALGKMHRG